MQDYHFALLPAMIRERLPRATILTFWHIPWPNPERFGICPWRDELLEGMLGSTILGFHTQLHCNNFIDSVDRYLEARIDREHRRSRSSGDDDADRALPDLDRVAADDERATWPPIAECRRRRRERLRLPGRRLLGVGVDRLDYTKGIEERLHAVERLLEKRPEWIGRFCFVQLAAPTRSLIEDYRLFHERIAQVTDAHQRALRQAGLPAGAPARRAPRAARGRTSCTAPPTSATSAACTTA